MVGSHSAGAETFNPLIDQAVGNLLGRCQLPQSQPIENYNVAYAAQPAAAGNRICFVGVENKSIEELGDFKDQIYQQIDTQVNRWDQYVMINKRFVDAGLRETRLRPDSLFVPNNMQLFSAAMAQMGQPLDYLLYATITSGTTENNASYQRDYLLTLELVNIHTGRYDKEDAKIRKGYHKSRVGMWRKYNPFKMPGTTGI